MNARIFMDAILNEVHAYCDNAGGKGAYIEVKPQGSVESIWIAICEKDLNSKELVDKIQVQGTRIVAKYSKQHKADILNAHIKQQMKADELLFPRQRVQWYIDGQILKYADASTWTSIDSDAIRSRCIACSDYFVESDLMICQIAKLTEVFVDKSYGMLMILSCMGGFMKSLLLRTDWFPDSAICFCGNGVSIMPVLNAFISYWVDYPPKVVSAMMSEKDFVRELAETGDELFVVDCGFEITASHYRESQRKSNIQIATRWGTQGCNCFPVLVSNNPLDICRMDNIVPLILNSGDMEWDILIEANIDNTCLANFVQLIRCYIEERGVAVQNKIDRKVSSQYASVQKEQLKQPGLIAIFRTIHSLIVDIIREECSDEENCNLFDSLCADALALLKVYLDFPSGDIIAEEFQETMNQLTNKGYFLYCDRYDDKVSEQEDCEKCYIYYDSSYLYMSLADFKSVVLTDMRECEKNASKILGYLEHSGFLSGYDNAKDFCVDVLIKSKPKRRSMLRFNRDKFQSIGGLDIIYRGGNYE